MKKFKEEKPIDSYGHLICGDPFFTDYPTVAEVFKGLCLYVGEGFLMFAIMHVLFSVKGSVTLILGHWYSLFVLIAVCWVLGAIGNLAVFLLKKIL